MKEEKIEAAMEHMGDVIEKSVDGAANKAWSHRPVRIVAKSLAFLTGAGLIASAFPLSDNGNHTASKICLISGCIVIIAGIAELIFIKRK